MPPAWRQSMLRPADGGLCHDGSGPSWDWPGLVAEYRLSGGLCPPPQVHLKRAAPRRRASHRHPHMDRSQKRCHHERGPRERCMMPAAEGKPFCEAHLPRAGHRERRKPHFDFNPFACNFRLSLLQGIPGEGGPKGKRRVRERRFCECLFSGKKV